MVVVFAPARTAAEQVRFGFVASKKLGCAPVRNRAKRLLRELCRREASLFPRGFDVVIIARQGLPKLKLGQLIREFERVGPVLRRVAEGQWNRKG